MRAIITHEIPVSAQTQRRVDEVVATCQAYRDELGLGPVAFTWALEDYEPLVFEQRALTNRALKEMDKAMKGWTRDTSKGVHMGFTGPRDAIKHVYQCHNTK